MKKVGIYKISYEQMGRYLNLPEDHHIVDVVSDLNRMREYFFVKVRGPKMPTVPEAQEIPWVPLDYLERDEE